MKKRIGRHRLRLHLATLSAVAVLQGCSGGSESQLLASARAHLEQKKPDAAVIDLKSALQKNPDSGQARLLLGQTLIGTGELAAGVLELRKALELNVQDDLVVPSLARALLLQGEHATVITQFGSTSLKSPKARADLAVALAGAHAQQGDLERSQALAEGALRDSPDHADAVLVLARLRSMAGDNGAALKMLDGLLQKQPDNEMAAAAKGELLWNGMGDTEAALTVFRKLLEKHPASMRAHASIITILFQRGQVAEARQQYETLRKLIPANAETAFFEAQFAFVDQKYTRVREITSDLLKVTTPGPRTLELAAAAEMRLGQDLRAQSLLQQALKAQPDLVLARQLLARSHLRASQPDKAIEVIQPLLGKSTVSSATLTLLGEASLQKGELKQAESAFKRASAAAPGDARPRTAAAVALLARGQSAPAFAQLEAIAASDPGVSANLALINAHLERRDVKGALKSIDELEKKQPDQPLAYQLRGQILASQRDAKGARAGFEAALLRKPDYFPAVAGLTAVEVATGNKDGARQRLSAYLKTHPKDPEALLASVELAESTAVPLREVLRLAQEAALANPEEPRLHSALVSRLLGAGDVAAALTAAQTAAAALPANAGMQELLGRAQMAAGDGQQAIATFNRLIAQQPPSAALQMSLATAQLALKETAAATRSLRQALKIDPAFAPARRSLAAMLLAGQQTDAALQLAREAQSLNPADATGWSLEGDVAIHRRDWDAAIKALNTAVQRGKNADDALKLHAVYSTSGRGADASRLAKDWLTAHPSDVAFRFHLGDQALRKKDFAEAEKQYREVLAVQPRQPLALNNVAWLMAKQSKPGAVSLAEQANALLPGRVPFMDTLAMAQASEGQMLKAVETQKRALARSPDDPSLRLGLARYLIGSGDKGSARSELEKLRALGDRFPDQAEVQALLKAL